MSDQVSCCCVIPVYNQPDNLAALVRQIAGLGLHCIVIDDGSNEETAGVVASIDHCTTRRLEVNSGKGEAVLTGFEIAKREGFTHVIQIDADGQHDTACIPQFLQMMALEPNALICGARRYQDMPVGRRRGRKITDTCVRISTLSSAIQDSMCGFRVYPLEQTCVLLDQHRVGRRMDFDTDIAVRLYWAGVPVRNIAVPVRYDDEVPSNFRMLHDNVRISGMHARHFLGMLVRLPSLLVRNRMARK